MENAKILIVEDEENIARFLEIELLHEGFTAVIETNGKKAYRRILEDSFDLILLDIMLPDMDGFEICKLVRKVSTVPIIILTAKDDVKDKVEGLDLGADDYLTKPFSIEELLARIRVIFRKTGAMQDGKKADFLFTKDLVIYPARYEVRVGENPIELTKKEYLLLEFLLKNKRTVLTREDILREVWGYNYVGDTNVVDVYIRYLRAKIDDRFKKKYISTMRGVGYVIKD